jgi:hypothetical protein
MKRFLLGGFATAGLLLGGLAVGGTATAVEDPTIAESNQISTWCKDGPGIKIEPLSGQTFTIPSLPVDAPAGSVWTKLVLNGGANGPDNNRSEVYVTNLAVGTVVTRPGAAVSNAILCYGTPTPPVVDPPVVDPPVVDPPVVDPPVVDPPVVDPPVVDPPVVDPPVEVPPTDDATSAGPVPPAAAPTAAPPAATAQAALPATGSSSWGLALTALASLLGGMGLLKLSRRTS